MKINDLYEEDEFLTDKYDIINYMKETFDEFDPSLLEIELDGLVYEGELVLTNHRNISKLKVQFKKVTGVFYCCNTKIISLEGCPKMVGGHFSCSTTNITTLKYCPKSVRYSFYCVNINIIDPKEYRWALYCDIGKGFHSSDSEIDDIINEYKGTANRKHWPHAINLLSTVKL